MYQISLSKSHSLVCPYIFSYTKCITYSHFYPYVFTLDEKHNIVIWDKESFLPLKMISGFRGAKNISISNNSTELLITGDFGKIALFDFISFKTRYIKTFNKMLYGVFLSTKQYFIAGGAGKDVLLINAENNEYVSAFEKPSKSETQYLETFPGSNYFLTVEGILSSLDSNKLVNLEIACYDLRTREVVYRSFIFDTGENRLLNLFLRNNCLIIERDKQTEIINLDKKTIHKEEALHALYRKTFFEIDYKDTARVFGEISRFISPSENQASTLTQSTICVDSYLGCLAAHNNITLTHTYKNIKAEKFESCKYNQFHLSSDLKYILLFSAQKNIQLIETKTWQSSLIDARIASDSKVVFFNEPSLILFVNPSYEELTIFDIKTNKIKNIINTDEYIFDYGLIENTNHFFIATTKFIYIYNVPLFNILNKYALPDIEFLGICTPDFIRILKRGNYIYIRERNIGLFNILGRQSYIKEMDIDFSDEGEENISVDFYTCSMDISPCKKYVLCGSTNGFAALIDINSGNEKAKKRLCDRPIEKILILEDGEYFLAADDRNSLFLVDLFTLEIINEIKGWNANIKSMAYTPHKKHILIQEGESNYHTKSDFNISTFLDSKTFTKKAILLICNMNNFGFFLNDGSYEVTADFMAENYITSGLKISDNKDLFMSKSTKGLLINFIKDL